MLWWWLWWWIQKNKKTLEDYLKGFKPIKTDNSFDGKKNSYIKYISKGDKYENLSPKRIS